MPSGCVQAEQVAFRLRSSRPRRQAKATVHVMLPETANAAVWKSSFGTSALPRPSWADGVNAKQNCALAQPWSHRSCRLVRS
jgi:hypothetical protein